MSSRRASHAPLVLTVVSYAGPAMGFVLLGYLWGLQFADDVRGQAGPAKLFDRFLHVSDVSQLEKEAATLSIVRASNLQTYQEIVHQLSIARSNVIDQLALGMSASEHVHILQVLQLLKRSATLQKGHLDALAPYAHSAGSNGSLSLGASLGIGMTGEDSFLVEVTERPFGMHVDGEELFVEEVFPGFPAHRLGIHPGCRLLEIAGSPVSLDTWTEVFQHAVLPTTMRLTCGVSSVRAFQAEAAAEMNTTHHSMVMELPFGMIIQVDVVPRVVEVTPGYPAERVGVRVGFVLAKINDTAVYGKEWLALYRRQKPPFSLTFDISEPPIDESLDESLAEEDVWSDSYEDFACDVLAAPFGVSFHTPPGGRPMVKVLLPFSLAAEAGVQMGDVLVEVDGSHVSAMNWFAAVQQAVPPYALRFRRKQAASARHQAV